MPYILPSEEPKPQRLAAHFQVQGKGAPANDLSAPAQSRLLRNGEKKSFDTVLREAYPALTGPLDLQMMRLCLRLKRRPTSSTDHERATIIDSAMPQMASTWRGSTPMTGWP